MNKPILYSVALPIGDTGDFSERSKGILESVDFIACEDKRKLQNWISRANIQTKAQFYAYHAKNEVNSANGLLLKLKEGSTGALVSDAGTPNISDPGLQILRLCWENEISVKPIPGPSALTCLSSVAPFSLKPLLFLGFLSPKPGKRLKTLEKYDDFIGAICIYETIHRIDKLLSAILNRWGNLSLIIGRELTKQYEELFWGEIEQAQKWVVSQKGEFVMIINKKENAKL